MSSFVFPPPPPPAPTASSSVDTSVHYERQQYRGQNSSRGRRGSRGYFNQSRKHVGSGAPNYRAANINRTSTPGTIDGSHTIFDNSCFNDMNEVIPSRSAPRAQLGTQDNTHGWLSQPTNMYSQTAGITPQQQQSSGPWIPNCQNQLLSEQYSVPGAQGVKRKCDDAWRSPNRRYAHGKGSTLQPRRTSYSQVAPAVQNFGFSSSTLKPVKNAQTHQSTLKKEKHNILGLTPRSAEGEESEEGDDVDEETQATTKGQGFQFEHDGRISSLRSEQEIAAWIAERKRRYPTKARIAQKNAEIKKRKEELEEARNRALKSSQTLKDSSVGTKDRKNSIVAEFHLQKTMKVKGELKATEQKAAGATSRKSKSTSQNFISCEHDKEHNPSEANKPNNIILPSEQKASTAPRLGLDYSSTSASDADDLALESSSSISESSDSTSSASDSETSSLSTPCASEVTSKVANPTKLIESNDIPRAAKQPKKRPCKFYMASAKCRHGQKCRFSHDVSSRSMEKQQKQTQRSQQGSKRITLSERLQMQEQLEREKHLLHVIKGLGQRGVFDAD